MRYFFVIILISLNLSNTYTQSYEGTIGGNYHIWVDLSIPTADGGITGTYFYKNKYIPISLKGKKINKKIELTERNKSNTITGIFTLNLTGDSLIGSWKNTKRNILYNVLLLKSDSKYKPKEKIDVGFFEVDSTDIESGYTTTSYKNLLFARKNIYTYQEGTTINGGTYPIGEARTYTVGKR